MLFSSPCLHVLSFNINFCSFVVSVTKSFDVYPDSFSNTTPFPSFSMVHSGHFSAGKKSSILLQILRLHWLSPSRPLNAVRYSFPVSGVLRENTCHLGFI